MITIDKIKELDSLLSSFEKIDNFRKVTYIDFCNLDYIDYYLSDLKSMILHVLEDIYNGK